MNMTLRFFYSLTLVIFLVPTLTLANTISTGHGVGPQSGARQQAKSADKDKGNGKIGERKFDGSFINGKMTFNKFVHVNGFHKGEPVVVIVDKGSHFTYVLQKQNQDHVFKVFSASNATGGAAMPSPYGRFTVAQKLKWPSWIPPKSIEPKGKAVQPYNKDRRNPLGVARISLNKFGIALHGTNDPHGLRKNISHGCIRHSNKDIMTIFNMVKRGTPVYIVHHLPGTTITKKDFSSS